MLELQFKKFLKGKVLKFTKERHALFDGIKRQKGHFSVDILVFQLKQKGFKVSRDTVYRNIPLLLESGVIRQSFRTGRDTMYELADGRTHHDHLLCRKCGKIEEFIVPVIEKVQEKVAKDKGFALEYHCHHLVGVCKKCRKA